MQGQPHQPPRMRLLKFVNVFDIGGTERQVVNLGQVLDPSKFQLHLACFERGGCYLSELEPLRLPLSEYSIRSLYGVKTFAEQLRFAKYLQHHQIHLVHSYGFYANVFAIPSAKLAGASIIVASIRDTGAYLSPAQKRVQRVVSRLADRIVVNAEAVRRWLIDEGYSDEKITVIRNGIDLSRFARKRVDGRLRQELGIPPHAPLVAVLSRLNQVKGIDYFLEAAAIVTRRFKEARFVIIGDCVIERDRAYKKALEEYAVTLGLGGRVLFAGLRLDVPELLSQITVSVLSSLSEGLSNTLLESLAAGVPVVATSVGGTPEAVVDGVTGFLVPPRDPAAMARAICVLLGNREMASAFGRAGQQRVTEHFSLERMGRETEELYLGLMEKARQKKSHLVQGRPPEIRSS